MQVASRVPDTSHAVAAAIPTPADPVPEDVSQANWEIIKAEGVTKASWEAFAPTKKAAIIDALDNKPAFASELIQGAKSNVWPQDGADADITNLVVLEAIKVDLGISWNIWNGLIKGRREVILSALSDTANSRAKEIAKELATGAKSEKWPKAGTDTQDIQDYKIWDEIKKAYNSMNIERWNGLAAPSREDIIAAATPVEKRKFIDQAFENLRKQAHYKRDKENTRGEKVAGGLGKVFGNPIADAVSGSLGLTSSIYGAKGEATDDEGAKASAKGTASTVGKVGDVFDTVQQSATLLDSLATWRSGSRLDNINSSRAARSLGRKKRSEGKWGASQSAAGLGGSVSGLVSDFGKEHDDPNAADITSGGFGVAGGLLGSIKGIKGFFGSRRRSNKAAKIAKDDTANGELKDIAAFTQKNQNRTGRALDGLKGAASIGSGIAKFFGSSMTASIAGGIGLVSGIGSAIVKRAGKPDEAVLTQKAQKLADLLMAKDVKAIDFAIDVLNIDIKSREPEEWRAWVLEDPEAVKELIKSKLSKQG